MFWLGKSIKVETEGSGKKKQSVNISPLEVIILAQLRSRELRNEGVPVGQYGYEMIQQLNELFAGTWEAKSGTIYPILSKLEKKKGMIVGERKKSPLGPVKKVYELVDRGRDAIDWVIRSNFEGDIQFISNFLNLLAPFLTLEKNQEELDDIFEKLLIVPKRAINIAHDKAITEMDKNIQESRLRVLKNTLKLSLEKIQNQLNTLQD